MPAADAAARVAIVLPPREDFSPSATGALGLLVHRLASWPGGFSQTVLGVAQAAPFADVDFRPVRPSWFPGSFNRRYARGAARVLRALGPCLIEVHNRPDLALFLARNFRAVPVALFLNNDPQGMRGARSAADRGRLLARLALVATSSDFLAGRLAEGVDRPVRPPVVVANWLDLREVPPSPAARSDVILFAGRVVRDKGADSFVRACALALPRLPGWRAEMIGADRFGPDSPETAFLRDLRPQAAAAGVVMQGYRPHPQVMAAMAEASIVVVPSRWDEPFGLTALEAMAAGAALLCAPRGGLPEVFGDAGVAIDPDDPAAMAEAMVALAGDPMRRAALAAAGRARARGFDLPVAAARIGALRRQVIADWSEPAGRPI